MVRRESQERKPKKKNQRVDAITLALPSAQIASVKQAQSCLQRFAVTTDPIKSALTALTSMKAKFKTESTRLSMAISLHRKRSVQSHMLAIRNAKIAHILKINGTLWTITASIIHLILREVVSDASHNQ